MPQRKRLRSRAKRLTAAGHKPVQFWTDKAEYHLALDAAKHTGRSLAAFAKVSLLAYARLVLERRNAEPNLPFDPEFH